MPTFLEIAVNVPQVTGVFHYHLPPELEGCVGAGNLVEVPFGRQTVQGIVLRPVAEPEVPETRPVLGLLDPQPVLTLPQLALSLEMAESTLSPLASIVSLMLPPGLGQMADVLYALTSNPSPNGRGAGVRVTENRLLTILQTRGPLRGRQIDAALPHVEWRGAAQALVKRGILTTHSVLPPPTARPKTVRTVQLACPPEVAEACMPELGKAGSQALARRQAMLRFLLREPGPVDVAWVYAESGGKLGDLHILAERSLVILGESEVWRDPLARLDFTPSGPPPLTHEQQSAWAEVRSGLQDAAAGQFVPPFLLHGVTGSGKTEVYLHAVEETIQLGKQAIVLVPEIALTPQTVRRFVSRFPGRVGLAHSGLSPGERYDTWRRARAGLLSVIVGPRSALFMPFPKLGLIVVDECHDDSYYQSEPPFYHARDAAITYARLAGAVCLLGSATPDMVSRYRAQSGGVSEKPGFYSYLSLPARILAHRQAVQAQVERLGLPSHYHLLEEEAETIDLPPVQVVDMRQELQAGNTSIFSRALQDNLAKTLHQDQQAILFLNRRGSATYVFCRECGYTLKCPRCDLPLTYHTLRFTSPQSLNHSITPTPNLQCHHCGYRRAMPSKCPECGSTKIRQYGAGTEKVEADVQALFPQVRTLRWDYETTRQKGAHEIILSHFSNHRADVLIGTQMIAKGLDLPLVTLVGVVLADVGLNMPDYRAAERTFNVLTQVAGRAGRSPLGGQVILQTFQPEHYVIQAAALHDYESFYRQELQYRRRLGYPPFGRLVRLEFRHVDATQAETAAQAMTAQIRGWIAAGDRRATEIVGPVPCFFARVGGMNRWQIVLRGPDPASLLRGRALGGWRVEVDPVSLL
jgi:primosomal protein N' (replication factor Y)